MGFRRNFFYWAAYASHGFADVQLDNCLLHRIRDKLKGVQTKYNSARKNNKDMMAPIMLNMTGDTYHRLDEEERRLSCAL